MLRFPRRPDRRLVTVALTALVLASACVRQDDPGMDVVALDAEIVFGIQEAPAAVEPVGFVPPPAQNLEPEVLEDLPQPPPLPRRVPTPPQLPTDVHLCPTAPIGEFPETAPVDVTTQPTEGSYLWRPGPPTILEADHFDVTAADLFERVIFNVSKVTEMANPEAAASEGVPPIRTFTYQMATYSSDAADSTVVVDTFRVVSGGITTSVGAINLGPEAYTGQPDRGVSLVSREVIANNRVVSAFRPTTPVLLLPLPAIGGSTFQTVSYDPVYGTTYMLYGEVKERARVDACGKEVDGWRVVAQTALRDPRDGATAAPRTATLTYFVATGLGGVLSYESRSKLELPRFPVNGTPLDGGLPPNPELPDSPSNAEPYEFSLATLRPGEITKPEPQPEGLLGDS